MPKMPGKNRPTATSQRTERYGKANQMAHEQSEKLRRDAMKERMAKDKAMAKAAGKKRMQQKSKETGMNKGTMGFARTLFGM